MTIISKNGPLLMAKMEMRESPASKMESHSNEVANRMASRAAEASPRETSKKDNFWVRATRIQPLWLLITAETTLNKGRTATSKFALKDLKWGGVQWMGREIKSDQENLFSLFNLRKKKKKKKKKKKGKESHNQKKFAI
jgi:hypothetical protein